MYDHKYDSVKILTFRRHLPRSICSKRVKGRKRSDGISLILYSTRRKLAEPTQKYKANLSLIQVNLRCHPKVLRLDTIVAFI